MKITIKPTEAVNEEHPNCSMHSTISITHPKDDHTIDEFTREEWYIDGKKLTEEQFKNHLTLLPKNRRSRVERVLRYALCSDSRR